MNILYLILKNSLLLQCIFLCLKRILVKTLRLRAHFASSEWRCVLFLSSDQVSHSLKGKFLLSGICLAFNCCCSIFNKVMKRWFSPINFLKESTIIICVSCTAYGFLKVNNESFFVQYPFYKLYMVGYFSLCCIHYDKIRLFETFCSCSF